MATPFISGLVAENWQTLSGNERLQALGQLEVALANQVDRQPASVSSFLGEPGERGSYDSNTNTIWINQALLDHGVENQALYGDMTAVNKDEPYMAVQAVTHESRHAYQHYVANERPDLAESQQQLTDFQKNEGAGYMQPREGVLKYEHQPTEIDSRRSSMEFTDDFYSDDPAYKAHQNRMIDEEQVSSENARFFLGEDYENQIRNESYQRHDAQFAAQQTQNTLTEQDQELTSEFAKTALTEGVTSVAGPIAGEAVEQVTEAVTNSSNQTEGNTAQASENSASAAPAKTASASDEEYDYSQGYGY